MSSTIQKIEVLSEIPIPFIDIGIKKEPALTDVSDGELFSSTDDNELNSESKKKSSNENSIRNESEAFSISNTAPGTVELSSDINIMLNKSELLPNNQQGNPQKRKKKKSRKHSEKKERRTDRDDKTSPSNRRRSYKSEKLYSNYDITERNSHKRRDRRKDRRSRSLSRSPKRHKYHSKSRSRSRSRSRTFSNSNFSDGSYRKERRRSKDPSKNGYHNNKKKIGNAECVIKIRSSSSSNDQRSRSNSVRRNSTKYSSSEEERKCLLKKVIEMGQEIKKRKKSISNDHSDQSTYMNHPYIDYNHCSAGSSTLRNENTESSLLDFTPEGTGLNINNNCRIGEVEAVNLSIPKPIEVKKEPADVLPVPISVKIEKPEGSAARLCDIRPIVCKKEGEEIIPKPQMIPISDIKIEKENEYKKEVKILPKPICIKKEQDNNIRKQKPSFKDVGLTSNRQQRITSVIEELTSKMDSAEKGIVGPDFLFTRSKLVVSQKNPEFRSPLLRYPKVNFLSTSAVIHNKSFGIISLPACISNIAKAIGYDAAALIDKFGLSKELKTEKIETSGSYSVSTVDFGTQTDMAMCIECINKKLRKHNVDEANDKLKPSSFDMHSQTIEHPLFPKYLRTANSNQLEAASDFIDLLMNQPLDYNDNLGRTCLSDTLMTLYLKGLGANNVRNRIMEQTPRIVNELNHNNAPTAPSINNYHFQSDFYDGTSNYPSGITNTYQETDGRYVSNYPQAASQHYFNNTEQIAEIPPNAPQFVRNDPRSRSINSNKTYGRGSKRY